jgi:S-formylglutathione hydrolase FrmB
LNEKLLFCFIFITAVVSVAAQSGKIINDEMHAVSLEGNLIGDSPKRSVLVYLPPNYDKQTEVRYPVVYLLHGFTVAANKTWIIENEGLRMNISAMMDKLIAEQKVRPMILVMPDGSNKFGGSFYTNSITTGNWEDFITRDLISFIDKKYRTMPNAESRGIVGHSMGGYGAIKLAMKHPDIYGAVYATSPCCLEVYPNLNAPDKFMEEASNIKSWEEIEKASFFARTFLASAAAFSPNPAKPPFFADFEDFITRDLISFIDKKYRTMPNAESRGIVGHSMGGYGAIKLAMKHPDIYGAVYATSPCCLEVYPNLNAPDKFMEEASNIKSWEEIEKASFFARTFLASAAAFSPNPAKPPFFADFPVKKKGEPDAVAEQSQARWLANTPMWMIDQYRANLARLRGIAFDVGTSEDLLNSIRGFSGVLKRNKIQHIFEEFDGDHIDKTAERIETRILPFFSRTLVFQTSSKKVPVN